MERLPYRRAKRLVGVPTGVVIAFRVLNHEPILVLDAFKRQKQGCGAEGHLETIAALSECAPLARFQMRMK